MTDLPIKNIDDVLYLLRNKEREFGLQYKCCIESYRSPEATRWDTRRAIVAGLIREIEQRRGDVVATGSA